MTLKQLSIFLENKPGRLSYPCNALAKAGINILTLCLADTEQFGILRIIVREWEKARAVLEANGCVVNVSDVLAIEIPDRPGGMGAILTVLEPKAVNIEYMYAFTVKRGSNAVMIVRVDKPDQAASALQQHGMALLDADAFFRLA